MSKHTLSLRLSFGVCLLAGLVAFGCKEKPAVPFSEYGETIDHLPVVEDLPTAFPIADEIETKPCVIREQAEERAHHHLLESQGRGMELELEHRQKEEARRASQRAAQEKAAAEAAEPEITPPAEETAPAQRVQVKPCRWTKGDIRRTGNRSPGKRRKASDGSASFAENNAGGQGNLSTLTGGH